MSCLPNRVPQRQIPVIRCKTPSPLKKLGALLFIFTLLSPARAEQKPFRSISWSPQIIMPGSPCLFTVTMTSTPVELHGHWMGHEIDFFPSGDHLWYGLAGVDVEAKPGRYRLELETKLPDGRVVREERDVLVQPAHYKTEALRVPERFVTPSPETLERIEAERKIKDEAFSHQEPEPEWSGPFVAPIDTTVSEGFGTRRTFNGKLASVHRGLDYHAKPGSPVTAANSGEVVLAQELYYEGNCVIIDHGQQFMTLYMHLSQIDVHPGEKVTKAQQVGLSGGTGRVTGPHLHTAVRWQGAYLDPALLWKLPLPQLPFAAPSQSHVP